MNNSVCFLVILLGAFALSIAEESTNSAKVQVVDNVNNFLRDNPGVTLTKLDSRRSPRDFLLYTMGDRQEGDHLSQTYLNFDGWESPKDVQVVFNYPASGGQGNVVTYVEVEVDQSSNVGNAYVVNGGLGQRSVSVLLEACNTNRLNYEAKVYGKDP